MTRQSRRQFLQGSVALGGLGLLVGCEHPSLSWKPTAKIPRVGYLALDPSGAEHQAFREGLGDLGYLAGQTIIIEERWAASNNEFPALATEVVRLPVDLIVAAGGILSIQASMRATSTIPIVFTSVADPVRAGLVASLARPGGNVTGLSIQGPQIQAKRLQLLREISPGVISVMLLADTVAAEPTGDLGEAEAAAQSLGVHLLMPIIRNTADLAAAFQLAMSEHVQGLWVIGNPLIRSESGQIVEFARAAGLPLLSPDQSFSVAGGLLSYGPSRPALFRHAATFVDKILKGAKPADLPVEQPTKFDFVINLKTAQTLGLTIPQAVLQQATEVIQ